MKRRILAIVSLIIVAVLVFFGFFIYAVTASLKKSVQEVGNVFLQDMVEGVAEGLISGGIDAAEEIISDKREEYKEKFVYMSDEYETE